MLALLRRRFVGASVALTALATFLGASGADARGVDPCPHHDAIDLARHGAAAHAGHRPETAHPHGHGDAADPGSGTTDGHRPCTCVGSCDTGGSPLLLARTPDIALVVAAPSPLSLPAHPRELVRCKGERWTPYLPHAPPASA